MPRLFHGIAHNNVALFCGKVRGKIFIYFGGQTDCNNISELALRWGVSKPTVSRLLNKLTELGYISLLNFSGRSGSVIYLKNYLSVMFQISDVPIDKEEVAMRLNVKIVLSAFPRPRLPLLYKYSRDGLHGLRLTARAKQLLLARQPDCYAAILSGNTAANAPKYEVPYRLRYHRMVEAMVTMQNAGVTIYPWEKPVIFQMRNFAVSTRSAARSSTAMSASPDSIFFSSSPL